MKRIPLAFAVIGLLAACAPAVTPASQAVEGYFGALAARDEAALRERVCGEYLAEALLEFDALAQVQTETRDLSCRQTGADGDSARVECRGSLVSNYGSDLFEYDLSGRTYRVVARGGRWLVCGFSR